MGRSCSQTFCCTKQTAPVIICWWIIRGPSSASFMIKHVLLFACFSLQNRFCSSLLEYIMYIWNIFIYIYMMFSFVASWRIKLHRLTSLGLSWKSSITSNSSCMPHWMGLTWRSLSWWMSKNTKSIWFDVIYCKSLMYLSWIKRVVLIIIITTTNNTLIVWFCCIVIQICYRQTAWTSSQP